MQLWDQFLLRLEKKLGKETVERWLKPLKVIRFDAANLYLAAQDAFHIAWFNEHITPFKHEFLNNNNRRIKIHLLESTSRPSSQSPSFPKESHSILPDPLNPEMTLSQFLPLCPSHHIALNLLSEMKKKPFNPIFFYGPPSSGKTHLLMAAAHLLKTWGKNPFYIRASTFTDHVVQAIRKGHMAPLRAAYRSSDALIIDDIHIFSRKAATQEEFFHTFNELHTRGSPILIASPCAPSKLEEIEPRLISRFEWGISVPIERGNWAPILEKKSALWKIRVSSDVIPFLIAKFSSNPLLPLSALALRSKSSALIDADLASKLLQDLLETQMLEAWTPEKIVKTLASHYGIKPSDILGRSQSREVALPRQVAMYLCREKLKLPLQKIGAVFGRDHSTVLSSVRQIQKGVEENNPDLCKAIEQIRS